MPYSPKIIDSMIRLIRPLKVRGVERSIGRFVPRNGERDILAANGYNMRVDLANGQHRQIYFGCFAREVDSWIRSILDTGDIFIDVGANVGFLTLLGSKSIGPTGVVHAIEPCTPTFTRLTHHVEINKVSNVRLHHLAISDHEGMLTLFAPPGSEHRDYNVSCVKNEAYDRIEVPAKRLDFLFKELNIKSAKLMKVDVEGAEPLVFKGGAECLGDGLVHYLICELNGPYLLEVGSSATALYEQIIRLGFKWARMVRGGRIVTAQAPTIPPDANFDAIFIHQSVLE